MSRYQSILEWIDTQQDEMQQLLSELAEVNSGTANLDGLAQLRSRISNQIAHFSDTVEVRPVHPREIVDCQGNVMQSELAPSLHAVRRRSAPQRVLLAIHMDTVYGTDSPFQKTTRLDKATLRGPGVADAKGGLVVLLYAVQALERFVNETGCTNLGWHVLINSDEEVGSPGSGPVFEQLAKEVRFGLLFEPSLPDGRLISARKGSGNFSIIVRGQSAHAGRDFHSGRNAVVAAAELATQLNQLNGRWPETTINVSKIDGGTPPNIVPDVAIVRFNIRTGIREASSNAPRSSGLPQCERPESEEINIELRKMVDEVNRREGFCAELHGSFSAPPKPLTPEIERMLSAIAECGRELGLELSWQESGGVCDGNRLAACGVPNVDTLGVRGGRIHSPEEYVLIDSLTERAKLTALMLMRIADGTLLSS